MKEKERILCVDDEEDIRKTLKDILEDEGFEVKTAIDGKDCLNQLKKLKPNVILLDILMPGLTTKEILAGIKRIDSKIPVIILTVVKLSEATKKKLLDSNMADFIEKPFDNNDLIKRIKKVIK